MEDGGTLEPGGKRLTSVTVIGWLWICIAIFMALSGIMSSLMFFLFIGPEMQEAQKQLSEQAESVFFPMFLFEYFGVLSLLQVAFAIFVIFSGIMFLKLRSWARLSLEVISWLSLLYIVVFGIFWVFSWVTITGQAATGDGAEMLGAFQVIGAIMGTVICLVFAVPLGFIIRFLRGAELRQQCVY